MTSLGTLSSSTLRKPLRKKKATAHVRKIDSTCSGGDKKVYCCCTWTDNFSHQTKYSTHHLLSFLVILENLFPRNSCSSNCSINFGLTIANASPSGNHHNASGAVSLSNNHIILSGKRFISSSYDGFLLSWLFRFLVGRWWTIS